MKIPADRQLSIYDGRDRIGAMIARRAGGVEAFDVHGVHLGSFNSVKAATAAINTSLSSSCVCDTNARREQFLMAQDSGRRQLSVYVYNRRERVGHVVLQQDGSWRAFDANGKRLGAFVTSETAAKATRQRFFERRGAMGKPRVSRSRADLGREARRG
jgi:hypothetical protein